MNTVKIFLTAVMSALIFAAAAHASRDRELSGLKMVSSFVPEPNIEITAGYLRDNFIEADDFPELSAPLKGKYLYPPLGDKKLWTKILSANGISSIPTVFHPSVIKYKGDHIFRLELPVEDDFDGTEIVPDFSELYLKTIRNVRKMLDYPGCPIKPVVFAAQKDSHYGMLVLYYTSSNKQRLAYHSFGGSAAKAFKEFKDRYHSCFIGAGAVLVSDRTEPSELPGNIFPSRKEAVAAMSEELEKISAQGIEVLYAQTERNFRGEGWMNVFYYLKEEVPEPEDNRGILLRAKPLKE